MQFYGTYDFKFPINDLLDNIPNLDGMEVVITATVGDRFLDEVIEGYSTARIFNSSVSFYTNFKQINLEDVK